MNALEIISLPTGRVTASDLFRTGAHSFHEGRARYVAYLAEHIARVTRGPVLDVGCGVGQLLSALADLEVNATGFDLSSEAVDTARLDRRTTVLQHDANMDWPFTDESYDAVTMFDVIEHFSAYGKAIREAYRVLKPDGHLFIVTVNRSSILHWILGTKWGALRDPEHVFYFDRRSVRQALVERGFELRETHTFFNLGIAGESAEFLRPFRRPGVIIFFPLAGDSIYALAQKRPRRTE